MPKKKSTKKVTRLKTKKERMKQPKTKAAKVKKPRTKAVKTKAVKTKVVKTVKIKPVKTRQKAKTTRTRKALLTFRDKKIQEIKRKLIFRKEALLNEAEEALNELPGQTIFPDLSDQASAETERSFMLRLRGRERRLLKKIEDAIERIDQRVFGICDKCGREIDIRRLEARPVTTMCIECKMQQEEEERLREK
jgi:DnaK suppressor protein